MKFCYNDGGRKDAGFRGETRDCVVRAISIATQKPYSEVYSALFELGGTSPRKGVAKRVIRAYMKSIGWKWNACMGIGTGCKVHLKADELPSGRLVVSVSRHSVAVINGVVHDTHDPTRDGMRCVYGYYSEETSE